MGYSLHFPKLLSICVAFFLVARVGTWMVDLSNWPMFIWCFCFTVTLCILIVDLFGPQYHLCLSWDNLLITWACYVTHYCLSASINNPLIYLQSCLKASSGTTPALPRHSSASVVYATDVAWTYAGQVCSLALCSLSQDCSRGWSKMLGLAESRRGRRFGMTSQPPVTLKGFWCQGMYEHKHIRPHTDPHTEHALRHTPLDRVMQVLVGAF